jgi:hypothetical protein
MDTEGNCKECEHLFAPLGMQAEQAFPLFRKLETLWCQRCGAMTTINYHSRIITIYAPTEEGPQIISQHMRPL